MTFLSAQNEITLDTPAARPAGKRDASLDFLRLLSMLAVMLVHTVNGAWASLDVTSFSWQCVNFYNAISRACIPCFVMISGALMLNPKREITLKELYCKRIPRLVTAWIFWAFCYAARHLIRYLLGAGPDALSLFWTEFMEGHFHLWFMGMIVGLYMILPLVKPIAADRKLLKYYLILSFTFGIAFPSLGVFDALKASVDSFLGKFYLYLPLGYSFYFLLGYYLYTEKLSKGAKTAVYALGAIGAVATVGGAAVGCLSDPNWGTRLFGELLVNVALYGAAVFLFTCDVLRKVDWSPKITAFLKRASDYTFGVYLSHEYFNILLPHLGVSVMTLPPLIMAPVLTVCCYIFSYAVSAVLHRIPIAKDWLV